jgi:DNA-binding HxlR family transcriptional regulator
MTSAKTSATASAKASTKAPTKASTTTGSAKTPAPSSAPRSGKPAQRSQQRAKEAINAALELFNRRWVLRVLWELRGEPMSFRALQSACGDLSPTVVNQRLAELREAALVDAGEAGYALTPLGRELIAAFEPLTAWAVRWQGQRR